MPYGTAQQADSRPRGKRLVPESNLRWNVIPPGRYALFHKREQRWHFFVIRRPDSGDWEGWTFVNELIGENRIKIEPSKREKIFEKIAADPLRRSTDFGKQSGTCGKCGKQLTDPDSIAKGIGPVCEQYY
jgi:hypothetical protein